MCACEGVCMGVCVHGSVCACESIRVCGCEGCAWRVCACGGVHGGYVRVCTCEDVYTWGGVVPGGCVHVRGVHVRVFA